MRGLLLTLNTKSDNLSHSVDSLHSMLPVTLKCLHSDKISALSSLQLFCNMTIIGFSLYSSAARDMMELVTFG